MSWVAIKMLTGDRAKFAGIVVGLTFAALLITQQGSIFCGLMLRTAAQISDISGADLWVMDGNVRYIDDVKPMIADNLYRVRGVDGVLWAVPLYKGMGQAKVSFDDRASGRRVDVASLIFEITNVMMARRVPPAAEPVISPPAVPRDFRAIAGAGLIEAKRENIPIGTLVAGVVTEVYVKRGDMVKKGAPLFRLDDRDLKAQLLVAEANLQAAEAQYQRILAAPQQGDIPTSEASVEEAKAHFVDAEIAYRRSETLFERNAEAAQDRDHDRYAYLANKATLTRMEADLRRLKVTWEKDKEMYRAAVAQGHSQVESIRINLERLVVRALVEGEALQVHVRPGQYAGLVWNEPLIVLGDIHELHVRVDIDEQDLPYFSRGGKAVATLKGRPQVRFPLTYFDTEPYVIPKQSLTGSNTERVDTRVLQVLYALPVETAIPLFIGQQMDVYIEAAKPPGGILLDADPSGVKRPFEDETPRATGSAGPR